ncbi:MAG TPA: 50S ribosomal protein L35 [Candidatus Moranbacteria bacterium]|nr:50S ribosomal protein L35 [Candidatus Moranbacteria bacterium]
MAKLKTRKAVSKRFKITANKKVLKRAARQNHFNARQDSDHRRNKRRDCLVLGRPAKNILAEV